MTPLECVYNRSTERLQPLGIYIELIDGMVINLGFPTQSIGRIGVAVTVSVPLLL